MVYKAITPATDISNSDETELQFTESVNSYSELNYYAAKIENKAYINTTDNSLNEKTVNGKISRGEVIYLLMNTFYSDELADVDTSTVKFNDCESQTKKFTNEDGTDGDQYLDSYRAQVSLNNEEDYGCVDTIYKALVLANQKGIIGTETRYDEAITKVEAIQFLVDTLENSGEKFNYKNGDTISQAVSTSTESENTVTTTEEAGQTKEYEPTTDEVESTDTQSDTSTDTQSDTQTSTTSSTTSTITKDGATFASDVDPDNMQLVKEFNDSYLLSYDDFDFDGNGVIDKEEAEFAKELYDEDDSVKDWLAEDEAILAKEQSKSTTSSSTTTPSSSSSSLEERADETDPNDFIVFGQGDYSGLSTTGHTY
jgi:hypothetical protein